MSLTYGYVGLGNMGAPMAERLLAAEGRLLVHDLSAERASPLAAAGAEPVDDVHELAARVDVVLACLPSIAASRTVAAALAGGRAGTYVEMSTIGMSAANEIAEMLRGHGIDMVDAPVSGGGEAARRGALTIMVSGPAAARERVRPALEAIGRRVMDVAEGQGLAQVMKLLNNLCTISQIGIALEACAFGVKAGLDPEVMLEILNSSSGRSGATRYVVPQVVERSYETGASMSIAYKDLALCVAEAERLGVPLWLGSTSQQLWRHGLMKAGGEADMSHLADLIETWAGVEIKR